MNGSQCNVLTRTASQTCVCVPELCETLGADVLTGVLNAGQQVGDELVDGAFVLDGSRDALSYFNLIALTGGGTEEMYGSVTSRRAHKTLVFRWKQ